MVTNKNHNKKPLFDFKTKSNKGAEIFYLSYAPDLNPYTQIDLINAVLFERIKKQNEIYDVYIKHPYKSDSFKIFYDDNMYLNLAKDVWENEALERVHPTATVLVAHETIIGKAGNGLTLHTIETCERKKLNMPTGQGYHLCNGNHLPENHSEPKAIRNAIKNGNDKLLQHASAYLYGHWWSCIDCSTALENAGIKNLYVSKNWTRNFLGI